MFTTRRSLWAAGLATAATLLAATAVPTGGSAGGLTRRARREAPQTLPSNRWLSLVDYYREGSGLQPVTANRVWEAGRSDHLRHLVKAPRYVSLTTVYGPTGSELQTETRGVFVIPHTTLRGGRFVATVGKAGEGAIARSPAERAQIAGQFVGMASSSGGGGYWLADAAGYVYPHGTAGAYGTMGGRALERIEGIAATPDGKGYWLVGTKGGIYPFGDARFHGSMTANRLGQEIVGIIATPDGKGYWLIGTQGGVYPLGDARFHGSMTVHRLGQEIVGIAATPDGKGYWLVGSGGAVFAFGDAHLYGSLADQGLGAPIVGIAATPDGKGYWLITEDGSVHPFGDAHSYGSD